jgi:hypothetical protein
MFNMLKSLALTLVVAAPLSAATYYVDFAGGKDTNDGTTLASAFQHAPGDPAATDRAGHLPLLPGDVVQFKPGSVYRGSISIAASGAEGKPLTFDGQGVILEGAQPLAGWKKFAKADEAAGNPNWEKLLYTDDLPENLDPLSLHVSQGSKVMFLAQSPAPADLFWWDSPKSARPTDPPQAIGDKLSRQPIETTLADKEFLNQPDANAWAGGYVAVLGKPMKFYFGKIEQFEPAEHRLRFKMASAPWYTPSKYVILNALRSLVQPGQFVLWRGVDGAAKPRLIAWPLDAATFERDAQIAVRKDGIAIHGDYVTVRGFTIQNLAGELTAIGSSGHHHVTIDGNTIRYMHAALNDRQPTINLSQVSDFVINNNTIHDNIKCIGLLASKSTRGQVTGNTIRRNGDTQADFYTCKDIKVTGNTMAESAGHHANGFTFYLNNANILVENNKILCNRPITFHSIDNITIRNNLLDSGGDGNCISIWMSNVAPSSNVLIEHNTMVNATPDSFEAGIYRQDKKGTNVVVRNNIVDGFGGVWNEGAMVQNNLLLRVVKMNKPEALGEGNFLVEDAAKVFVDPAKGDYRLKEGSAASAKATDGGDLGASLTAK